MIEKLTYSGVWFLPNNKEKVVPGTLTFNHDEGADLQLIGSLNPRERGDAIFDPDFILGYTADGKKITLYKSYEYSLTRSLPGFDESRYSPSYILVGEYFTNETEFIFHKIKAQFQNLNEWISVFGFKKAERDKKKHDIEINYKRPASISFNVNEDLKGKLNFTYKAHTGESIQKAVIEQMSEVIFEIGNPKPFSEILNDLMLFQNFLTLGTFESAYPLQIAVFKREIEDSHNEEPYQKIIEVIYKPGFNFKKGRKKIPRDFLFNYKDIEDNFEIILQKWFSIKSKIEPVTNLLFDSFYQQGKSFENSFLNIVQAIETFHRRFRNNSILSNEDHKKKIKDIVESDSAHHKDWLQSRLNFSNEPTLHQRLDELINEISEEILTEIIKNKDQLIRDIKNSRNYYTHYDIKTEKKSLKGVPLNLLTEKLRVILIVAILIETGFTRLQVENLFKRNKFSLFNHILDNS